MMVLADMLKKLVAQVAVKVKQSAATDALEVEMVTAIAVTYVLIHERRLRCRAEFPYASLLAQLGKSAVDRALRRRASVLAKLRRYLLGGELSVGVVYQKVKKLFSSRRVIGFRHSAPPCKLRIILKFV